MINFLFGLGVFIGVLFFSAICEALILTVTSVKSKESTSGAIEYIIVQTFVMAALIFLLVAR